MVALPPPDIIYSAIDVVVDITTLKYLSLSCKLLSEYSQRRLLRAPCLRAQLELTPACTSFEKLLALLEEKPSLSTAIKAFSLAFEWNAHQDVLPISPSRYMQAIRDFMNNRAGLLLSKLGSLESISLSSLAYYEIFREVNVVPFHWLHHISSPSLRSIRVKHLPLSLPKSLSLRAPKLQILLSDSSPIRIHDIDTDAAAEGVTPASSSVTPLYLDTFQFISDARDPHQYIGEPELETLLDSEAFSFVRLRHLIFGSMSSIHHGAAAQFLTVASHTLSHLTFHLPYKCSDPKHGRTLKYL